MILLLINLAGATPTDSKSGECATTPEVVSESTGKALYEANCAVCHLSSGTGEIGYFPPLIDTPWVKDSTAFANILYRGLSGTITVNGERYASYMSPYGKDLSDKEVYDIIYYVQHTLNDFPINQTFTPESLRQIKMIATQKPTVRGQKGLDALLRDSTATQ